MVGSPETLGRLERFRQQKIAAVETPPSRLAELRQKKNAQAATLVDGNGRELDYDPYENANEVEPSDDTQLSS
jgi:hypothetical protein